MQVTRRINHTYRNRLFSGLLAGVGAFLGGYGLTWAFVTLDELPTFSFAAEKWQVVTWYFYNAQFVEISQTISGSDDSNYLRNSVDLITNSSDPYIQFLHLLPLVAIFIGGVLLASHLGRARTAPHAALNGAHVVVGYLPISLVGAYIASKHVSAIGVTARVGPGYLDTLLFMGLLLPLVVGSLGGLVYHVVRG